MSLSTFFVVTLGFCFVTGSSSFFVTDPVVERMSREESLSLELEQVKKELGDCRVQNKNINDTIAGILEDMEIVKQNIIFIVVFSFLLYMLCNW